MVYHFNPLEPRQVGKLVEETRRDDPGRHADVPAILPAPLRAGGFRHARSRRHRRREAAARIWPTPFEEQFGVRPLEGYGTTELSPVVSVNIPPSRAARDGVDATPGGHRRPAAARHRGPRSSTWTPAQTWAGQIGDAADHRPQRDEGLSRPARPDRRSDARRLVRHRRRRARSTPTDSSTSPAGRAASRRSAAKWCRTSASRRL